MSKAEDFIREHTKDDSNTCWDDSIDFLNWSTSDNIRSVVDIARKEIDELIKTSNRI